MTDDVLKLMAHQQKGVDFLDNRNCAALLMDRGTGKTATVMVDLDQKIKEGKVKRALYVAPLSTLENVGREAMRFATHIVPTLVVGSRAKRMEVLKNKHPNLYIINYEGVRILIKDLLAMKFDYIIADESTRIKDRGTQISRAMVMIGAGAKYKRCLTGMPFTEGVEDAWSQFNFMDQTILQSNYFAFRNRYCVIREAFNPKTGRRYRTITGYKNLNEFEGKVSDYLFRAAKEDCLDLPPKVYQKLKVKMIKEQEKQYKKIQKQVYSEINGSEITHAIALTKMAKLRQVAAGFLYDDQHEPVLIPSSKYQELESVLDEICHAKKKVVIFTTFQAEPPMVESMIEGMNSEKRTIKIFTLPKKPNERQGTIDEWTAWKEGPAVLIANARSGGIGLNMTAADIAIFLSNDWRMEDRAQAEDRIHRIGSEVFSHVTIMDIITEGTIEEDILVALKEKRDLVEVFLERIRQKQNKAEAVK